MAPAKPALESGNDKKGAVITTPRPLSSLPD
jgi:hypothetical protein